MLSEFSLSQPCTVGLKYYQYTIANTYQAAFQFLRKSNKQGELALLVFLKLWKKE